MIRDAIWLVIGLLIAAAVVVALVFIIVGSHRAAAQEGGHDQFHDFYSGQHNAARGSCCLQDCQPVLAEWRDGVLYLLLERDGVGGWAIAPDEAMMPTPSPDWQYHACWPFSQTDDPTPRCWWGPGIS